MSYATSISLDDDFDTAGYNNVPPPAASSRADPEIAPWSEPTTLQRQHRHVKPIPKPPSYPLPFASRQHSSQNLPAYGRNSETQSIAESYDSTMTDSTYQSSLESRKKSSLNIFNIVKKARSRSKLSTDSATFGTSSHVSFASQGSSGTYMAENPVPRSPPPPPVPKKDKSRGQKKSVGQDMERQTQTRSLPDTEFNLDTNMDSMDGIVDLSLLPHSANSSEYGPATYASSIASFLDSSSQAPSSPTSSMFSNPFLPSPNPSSRAVNFMHDSRKISPKTIVRVDRPSIDEQKEGNAGTSWTAPESWAVEKEGGDADDPDDSSTEGSIICSPKGVNGNGVSLTPGDPSVKKKSRRKSGKPRKSSAANATSYKVRIYRADNSYHVASITLSNTVADLIPSLNEKFFRPKGPRETHSLYLKERGRERVLAQTERPANIVRRRLEQAGYDEVDGRYFVNPDDMTFLLKFVYKSDLLGPTAERLTFDEVVNVDLTGRSLRMIPIALHQHVDAIVYLNLSRNPMVELPLDFIQSCTTLRELRLSNMAMKKVPQSVRHAYQLHRLDLSCNRIVDLDDAGLDRILELTNLKLQNNRMEKLPWYFPRLKSLRYLNISNNKFHQFPSVVCEMPDLIDLDISFNMISELPEEIGRLSALERFIIVGNQISKLPDSCKNLVKLHVFDCRRNNISNLSVICSLPGLLYLYADHNTIHAFPSALALSLEKLEATHNDITIFSIMPNPQGHPYALSSLDISHAGLSSLDEVTLSNLPSLRMLKLDHNLIKVIPQTLGDLTHLIHLSCSDNKLDSLPYSIGALQRLETLDAHNNSLTELPASIWNCASLCHINVTSNLIDNWHDPPPISSPNSASLTPDSFGSPCLQHSERKMSTATSVSSSISRSLPPLVYALERLYVGENRLTDDSLLPLAILRELRVLNLSFNDIHTIPPSFMRNLTRLEELYLSGNQLTRVPIEDLHRLTRLSVLFLNGNQLQTLPTELTQIQTLTSIDAGNNLLRYNINNTEFDWNWKFNKALRYLNLSGNKNLEIRPAKVSRADTFVAGEVSEPTNEHSDFSELSQLRVLGLMDVTTTFMRNIPEENEDRRIRTSTSEVNGMPYGIADNLGSNGEISMFDLVRPEFREERTEALVAMFGRSQAGPSNNRISQFLRDNFVRLFATQLDALDSDRNETVSDALRRTFLRLNKELHDELYSIPSSRRKMSQVSVSTAGTPTLDPSFAKSGASGIVLYFRNKTVHVANAGDALAVISKQGFAELLSRKHDPFDRSETARIRAAEGWVSPKGLTNDEIDVSRSFGFYHLFPVVNARPDVFVRPLTDLDEFIIIGNRGLWDYVSYQTAVDIARSERGDPMIAAQKLRDFAISYGADGSTMIMVISVAELMINPIAPSMTQTSLIDLDLLPSVKRRGARNAGISDRNISRLDGEVRPPVGHIALVFTDIRNSTHLWDVNPGMPTAMRLHNDLLRRLLRFCGGYEVKTEGDAFMCSFPTALAALWWCLAVQLQLLAEPWPLEILECEDGKPIYDANDNMVARGLSVRMGIHCGTPVCEIDSVTKRMDYFGSMVNRASRINGCAAGGQIMCSADIVREINAKILGDGPQTEYSDFQPLQAIEAIRRMNISVISVGEVKLKGLENPAMLSLIYPGDLIGRHGLESYNPTPGVSASKVPFHVSQVRELGALCLRFEALALPAFKEGVQSQKQKISSPYDDAATSLPPVSENASDAEIMQHLRSLTGRIENAVAAIALRFVADSAAQGPLDERTLRLLLSWSSSLHDL